MNRKELQSKEAEEDVPEGGFQAGNSDALVERFERRQVLALVKDGLGPLGGLFLPALLHLHAQLPLPTLPTFSCCPASAAMPMALLVGDAADASGIVTSSMRLLLSWRGRDGSS
jgi:hypothetical protein